MDTYLLLYTEPPTREVFRKYRPGRLIFAGDVVTAADEEVYDRCIQLPPVTDLLGTLACLEPVAADHVIVQTEYGLLPGSLLAAARGLPAPTVEAANLCTNKWLFRKACQQQKLRQPQFALVESARQVRAFAESFPVVLKPIASTLQRLVTKVSSADELEQQVADLLVAIPGAPDVVRYRQFARFAGLEMGCDPTRQFLVEEYVDGPPLETDGLVFSDRVDLFGVTEQVHTPAPHFFIEGYLYPADGPDEYGLAAASNAAVAAIGLTNAGFSIEFRGSTIIEVNGRLGEDEGFPELFRAGLGRYPIERWIEGDTGRSQPAGHHAIAYKCWYQGGQVRSLPEPDGAVVLVTQGQMLHKPPHPDIWPHLAYALASHPTSSRAAYAAARERVDSLQFEIA